MVFDDNIRVFFDDWVECGAFCVFWTRVVPVKHGSAWGVCRVGELCARDESVFSRVMCLCILGLQCYGLGLMDPFGCRR